MPYEPTSPRTDADLGTFTWDANQQLWNGRIIWANREIELTLRDCESDADTQACFDTLRGFIAERKEWEKKLEEEIRNLYTDFDLNWRDDEIEEDADVDWETFQRDIHFDFMRVSDDSIMLATTRHQWFGYHAFEAWIRPGEGIVGIGMWG